MTVILILHTAKYAIIVDIAAPIAPNKYTSTRFRTTLIIAPANTDIPKDLAAFTADKIPPIYPINPPNNTETIRKGTYIHES